MNPTIGLNRRRYFILRIRRLAAIIHPTMARDPTYVSLPDSWGLLPLDQEEEIYYELRLPKRSAPAPSAAKGGSGSGSSSSEAVAVSIEETEDDYCVFDLSAAVGERERERDGEEQAQAGGTMTAESSDPSPPKRALLVMGAFASLRWLDCLADRLAAEGFEVLSYNHRGLPLGSYVDLSRLPQKDQRGAKQEHGGSGGADDDGSRDASSSRSRSPSCESTATTASTSSSTTSSSIGSSSSSSSSSSKSALSHHHTCELLAEDAWRLVARVWGADHGPIHVYGASMGGMIAQRMAVQELRRADAEGRPPRVVSLFLAVTCRGLYPFPGMDGLARLVMPTFYKTGLIRLALPFLISRSKERMLQVNSPVPFDSFQACVLCDPLLTDHHTPTISNPHSTSSPSASVRSTSTRSTRGRASRCARCGSGRGGRISTTGPRSAAPSCAATRYDGVG